MNYIWEALIQYTQENVPSHEINYVVQDNRTSPYMELQEENLYGNVELKNLKKVIDVNPYVRFFHLFDSFLVPDDMGYDEFNTVLADILLHYLGDIDLKLGMCRREFYIKFFMRDLESIAFIEKEVWSLFSNLEKRKIAEGLLDFYETSEYVHSFQQVIKQVFPISNVYIRDKEDIVLYMEEKENQETKQKLNVLIQLFLPINYQYRIHWDKTFGVIGTWHRMVLEEFIL